MGIVTPTIHHSQWGRSEVFRIYPEIYVLFLSLMIYSIIISLTNTQCIFVYLYTWFYTNSYKYSIVNIWFMYTSHVLTCLFIYWFMDMYISRVYIISYINNYPEVDWTWNVQTWSLFYLVQEDYVWKLNVMKNGPIYGWFTLLIFHGKLSLTWNLPEGSIVHHHRWWWM